MLYLSQHITSPTYQTITQTCPDGSVCGCIISYQITVHRKRGESYCNAIEVIYIVTQLRWFVLYCNSSRSICVFNVLDHWEYMEMCITLPYRWSCTSPPSAHHITLAKALCSPAPGNLTGLVTSSDLLPLF